MSGDIKPVSEMSNQEFLDWVMTDRMGGWIPLKLYLRIYPTESANNIEQRLRRGIWQRGVHYRIPDRSGAWVNLNAIRAWIEADTDAQGLVGPQQSPDLGG